MKNTVNTCLMTALFVVLIIAGLDLNAYAQADSNTADTGAAATDNTNNTSPAPVANNPFKDFNSMQDYLRSKGMDPYKISWMPIDLMCSSFKFDSDQTQYNKCMFDKAKDNFLFTADKSRCSGSAAVTYPDSLKTQQTAIVAVTDRYGHVHNEQQTTPPLSQMQLDQLRAPVVAQCMLSLSWVSADDWALGKTPPSDQPNNSN